MKFIHPDELKKYWVWVKQGLLKVIEAGSDGWIPEDVYTSIKLNQATLHIASEGEHFTGFVVLTVTEGYEGKKLFIWAAYHTAGNAVKKYLPELEQMAKKIGAKKIEFQSMRNWDKYYKRGMTTFSHEVF